MSIEIQDNAPIEVCECEGGDCAHKEVTQEKSAWTKHRGSEEIAFAFLLALTPLVVLTFFGQVGLI